MSATTLDALLASFARRRTLMRPLGWRALRVARRLGYEVEKCRESGYFSVWMPSRVDAPVLVAAGWTWTEGPLLQLEGR